MLHNQPLKYTLCVIIHAKIASDMEWYDEQKKTYQECQNCRCQASLYLSTDTLEPVSAETIEYTNYTNHKRVYIPCYAVNKT